ncbi:small nuclear ribonucleoprotein G isoform X1 [Nycticebus coucang]|uniref:small nuclear ribonucleoprotein G isoform X1 n=1 Tax=Nycticebus coucang TaxID=9470 RepID=UPI00234CAEE7|nr:small nuclear ribonucleoprotein G isoform X1 [Nycticebus coucang]
MSKAHPPELKKSSSVSRTFARPGERGPNGAGLFTSSLTLFRAPREPDQDLALRNLQPAQMSRGCLGSVVTHGSLSAVLPPSPEVLASGLPHALSPY